MLEYSLNMLIYTFVQTLPAMAEVAVRLESNSPFYEKNLITLTEKLK
jgi:hypothetical protein